MFSANNQACVTSRYGKHNGWNSRDHWPETFGERTVLESELEVHSTCENVTANVFVQFPCSVSCLSFHLRRTCLSLQFIVCFCSVVHRTVYTSARSCLSARTIHNLVVIGSSLRLRRPHKEKTITMSSMFALAHFFCSYSTPLTLTSSSSIPSSRTTSQVTLPINKHCATPPKEESGPLAKTTSPTGYEPNVIDNFDYSETTEIFLQEQSSGTMPSYLHDAELSDDTIGRALSSPLFTREREEPAGRRQAYHPPEESLLSSQSLSVCHVSTGKPVNELSSLSSCSSREMENETKEELQSGSCRK